VSQYPGLCEAEPFSRLAGEALTWLRERLVERRFAAGERVLSAGAASDRLFFIESGAVAVLEQGEESALAELVSPECFPLEALAGEGQVTASFRAVHDTACWTLDAVHLQELAQRSPEFADFRAGRLTSHGLRGRGVPAVYDRVPEADTLESCSGRPVERVLHTDALIAVLKSLQDRDADFAVVVDSSGKAIGGFGFGELLALVLRDQVDLCASIATVMGELPPVYAEDTPTSLVASRLVGSRNDRILVAGSEGGNPMRLIGRPEILARGPVQLGRLAARLEGSASPADLANAAREINAFGRKLVAQEMPAWQVSQVVSILRDRLSRRIIDIEWARAEIPGVDRLAWIVLGSQGRHEQTLVTDQDNGIIFTARPGVAVEELRQAILVMARRVNENLARCGIALCAGGIMAGNPRWCLTLGEWETLFGQWLDRPEPEALLNATIFFDQRPLWGDSGLVRSLGDYLVRRAPASARFLRLLGENARQRRVPIGFFRDFRVDRDAKPPNTLDLKQGALAVFVDVARVYALRLGIAECGTVARLEAVAEAGQFTAKEAAGWIDAFRFLQALRIKGQAEALRVGGTPGHRVDPDDLNDLDRRMLLESLRQAAKLQKRLALDFSLDN